MPTLLAIGFPARLWRSALRWMATEAASGVVDRGKEAALDRTRPDGTLWWGLQCKYSPRRCDDPYITTTLFSSFSACRLGALE